MNFYKVSRAYYAGSVKVTQCFPLDILHWCFLRCFCTSILDLLFFSILNLSNMCLYHCRKKIIEIRKWGLSTNFPNSPLHVTILLVNYLKSIYILFTNVILYITSKALYWIIVISQRPNEVEKWHKAATTDIEYFKVHTCTLRIIRQCNKTTNNDINWESNSSKSLMVFMMTTLLSNTALSSEIKLR